MALFIQSSNRVENLQKNLSARLADTPLQNPLAPEIIVVPTFAMGRWLNLRIAQQQGIAANIEYPQPASWLWRLAADVLDAVPEFDPSSNDAIAWKIFARLPAFLDQSLFAGVKTYLGDDRDDIKRWQLSLRIATAFDRYQHYRPDLIRAWGRAADDNWQSVIWRSLLEDLECHRVEVLSRLIEKLQQSTAAGLPERVSLFAVSSLPPLFVEVIQAVARHCDLVLYQHSPTDQYWADLKSRKAMSRLRLANSQAAEYHDTGNDLLASWGRQGQVLQDLLLEQGTLVSAEIDNYQPPENAGLLQTIQRSIFDISNEPMSAELDQSLSVEICHSPMRECQVLHNHLLALLDKNATLNPEDILVMVPEISQYAPYIEAVFKRDENQTRPNIAFNISDLTVADYHPLAQVFLQLLNLPTSRFARSEILSLLEVEEIRQRFEIDDQAFDDILATLETSQLRWGIDGRHKTSLGLPATEQNTWRQSRQRIFAGYALGENELWNDIAPLPGIDGGKAENLGKFWRLFERLDYWRRQLLASTDADEWQARLNRLLEDFFVETDSSENQLQSIRESIDALSLAGNSQISAALLRQWMQSQLANREVPGRLFSGGVTFCGMRPMRSLPFKVICLLGMNDASFPRRESPIEFDLMAEQWRPGDPLKGDEDRYLMLETLLCARQHLYISYTGRSLKDNSECQPSILLGELLEFIDSRISVDGCTSASAAISKQHPMQAFAAENFTGKVNNYDNYWRGIADAMRKPTKANNIKSWPNDSIGTTVDNELSIDLQQLRYFLVDPVRYFFNHRLKLRLQQQDSTDDDEVFELDGLENWALKHRLAGDILVKGHSDFKVLQAEGHLPHGEAAAICFNNIQTQLASFLPALETYQQIETQAMVFDLAIDDGLHLSGQVDRYYPGKGLMHFSTASMKGKTVIAAWLDHLVLCATSQWQAEDDSQLICNDRQWRFERLEVAIARAQLSEYCKLYQRGLTRPLTIFPNASFAWAQHDDNEKALKTATGKWWGNEFQGIPGDKDDEYIQLAMRGIDDEPLLHPEFEDCARELFGLAIQSAVEL